jgi:hypothetical protein
MATLRALRPYRRRLVILVVVAAAAGAALGELAPTHPAGSAKTTATTHGGRARR